MKLTLQNIALPLRDFVLELDVVLERGATAIFGPSGAGKTSLLDLIAGWREPASARITWNETLWEDAGAGVRLAPRARGIGYVAQDLALFPHLSVRENLCYGRKAGAPELFSYEHVTRVLEIEPLAERGIAQLSGGERQRVALARALLSSPQLLLLDEPLGSLDAALKGRILPYLARVREEFKVPMIYVTHDAAEARALCEEVLEMERGRVTRRVEIKDWRI
ncbi:MAG TPA: ATP-binding cassette domain-containing protein [Verrucomicrobiae bacterium]|jgi:molybdate transport system ATP-binding protein|nr:ATP-binding cassette domain-containing protein [Verrucomicrobiae bacterium]